VKKLLNYKDRVMLALLLATLPPAAMADTQFQLNNMSGTSGAGSTDFTTWSTKILGYFQSGVNLALGFFAASGVVLCGVSIKKVYDANKDQREPPKLAVIGIIVGATLTIVPVVIGILRNSASPT
jgi:hypothetical protein